VVTARASEARSWQWGMRRMVLDFGLLCDKISVLVAQMPEIPALD
jgi:hypothetical protein